MKKREKDVKQPERLQRRELEEPTEREDDLCCRKISSTAAAAHLPLINKDKPATGHHVTSTT